MYKRQEDNSKYFNTTYTVNAADTWERKTIVLPADTASGFNNDNGRGLRCRWTLVAGTDYTGGSVDTTWQSSADRATNHENTWVGATGRTWALTGVQLEVGGTATDFEHRSFEEELRLCSRYYRKIGRHMGGGREGYSSSAVTFYPGMRLTGSGAANIVTTLTTGAVMYSRGSVNNSTGTLNGTVGISTGATDQAFTASFSHNGASTGSTYNGTVSGFYVDGLTFDAEL